MSIGEANHRRAVESLQKSGDLDDRDIERQLNRIEADIAFLRRALAEQKEIVRLKAEFIEHQQSRIASLEKSVAAADEVNIRLVRMNAPR